MGKIDSFLMDANDIFPVLTMNTISGETIEVPKLTGDGYGVVIFYRGHW